jgi:hypothetical protein
VLRHQNAIQAWRLGPDACYNRDYYELEIGDPYSPASQTKGVDERILMEFIRRVPYDLDQGVDIAA